MLHIHARRDDGEPTQELDHFVPIIEGLRESGCDAILCLTTGSAAGRYSGTARYECLSPRPEMGSLDCGSMNFDERVFENSLVRLAEEIGRPVATPDEAREVLSLAPRVAAASA